MWKLEEVVFGGFIKFGDEGRVICFHVAVGCVCTGNKKLGYSVFLRVEDEVNAHELGICINNLTRKVWIREISISLHACWACGPSMMATPPDPR